MNIDLFIYAKDAYGYSTVAAPQYWPENMESYLEPYISLKDSRDIEEAITLIAGNNGDSYERTNKLWKSTYIMINSPENGCCAFLRLARIDNRQREAAEAAGIQMTDIGGRDNWTLEGFCCPYGKKEEFFLHVPSMILWLENEPLTLFFKYRVDRSIGQSVTIPQDYLFNPYVDNFNYFLPDVVTEDDIEFYELCANIFHSTHSFNFMYGPLAKLFNTRVQEDYAVEKLFFHEMECGEFKDPYNDISVIETKEVTREHHKYDMYVKIGGISSGDENYYSKIELLEKSHGGTSTVYETKRIDTQSSSVDIAELKFAAERVYSWAKKNAWNVNDADETEYNSRYSFEVEE